MRNMVKMVTGGDLIILFLSGDDNNNNNNNNIITIIGQTHSPGNMQSLSTNDQKG